MKFLSITCLWAKFTQPRESSCEGPIARRRDVNVLAGPRKNKERRVACVIRNGTGQSCLDTRDRRQGAVASCMSGVLARVRGGHGDPEETSAAGFSNKTRDARVRAV